VDSEAPATLASLRTAEVVEAVLAMLREHGGRATRARRLLLAALLQPGHHSAEEIAAAVRQWAPDVHLTTIYRNLDELERLQVVDRTYVGQGPAAYHLAAAPHGHLACETCGAITEIPDEAFQSLAETAMAVHGFAISPGRFAVSGRCVNCR
jgi:Fe2+ or Zn2+ uptake regulation protein